MSGYSGEYFKLLSQFDAKAEQQPLSPNVQIQKVASPTDSASVSDTGGVTATVGTPPAHYGVSRYATAGYGA